jgi:mercury(II) reductase
VGCVPSKTLLRATEALYQSSAAVRFAGIRGEGLLEDWRALVGQKDELVAELRQARYADLLPAYNTIAYREGPARLVDGGVAVNDSVVRAPKAIVATGSRPSLPSMPGIGDVSYLTSTSAMELDRLPASLLVIGGGFIGCELGQMFARAGVAVTIACRSRLLPDFEPEIGAALADYLREEGIDVRDGVTYREVGETPDGIALSIETDGAAETVRAERLLVATGRAPNTAGLGLEEAGVALTPAGGVDVDDRMRTSKIGVYAAGDVTGRDMFVYMAAYGAKLAAENALDGDGRCYDASVVPEVVFTDPQAARVGLTEAAARGRGLEVETSVLPLGSVPRALAARDTRGLIKLVAEMGTRRLLGAHILAPEGGECIQTAALAIKQGLTVTELGEMIFPYLTTVEGLKLAAQAFDKDVSMLSCCAG